MSAVLTPDKLRKEKAAPGIWRVHRQDCQRRKCDCPYTYRYRLWPGGPERSGSARTLSEARRAKDTEERLGWKRKAHRAGLHEQPERDCPECRREQDERREQVPYLSDYASAWIDAYQGGRRGFRENTRAEYRSILSRYALRYPGFKGKRLDEIGPREIDGFVAWLTQQPGKGGALSDKSIRNALNPLRKLFATAERHGLVRQNPCTRVELPKRQEGDEESDRARRVPFPEGVREIVLSLIPLPCRLLFDTLAATGTRRSEVLAIKGCDLHLDGERPYIAVRRALRRRTGHGLELQPLKTKYSKRNLPISWALADRLRALHVPPDALVFCEPDGTPHDPNNFNTRILRPALAEAGLSVGDGRWGFHTFRHHIASEMLAQGRTIVQISRWLGHSSAGFTLDHYIHLMNEDDLGGPVEVLASSPAACPAAESNGSDQKGKAHVANLAA